MGSFPFYLQHDTMDCGATCLKMVAKYYGKNYTLETLREKTYISRDGVSMLGISEAAEKIGFRTLGVKVSAEKLWKLPLPCVVHWKQNHFVVIYDVDKKRLRKKRGKRKFSSHNTTIAAPGELSGTSHPGFSKGYVKIADPGQGLIKYKVDEFLEGWLSNRQNGEEEGIALLFEPTPEFYNIEDEKADKARFSFLLRYLHPHKRLILQLLLGILTGTALQLIFPFLTQSIVDHGIGNNNLHFIIVVLIAQLTLYTAQTTIEFIRSWILLHITTRINISIISDFLLKLMKLPLSFFDTKMIGDIMQRVGDHNRIENFLTSSTLSILFSLVSFIVFASILAFYKSSLLVIFLIASTIHVLWVLLFLKKRKELDHKRFALASSEQSNLYQLITGMQEIKLNNCETQKRWEWEHIQTKLFRISLKGLALSQYQQSGAFFINEIKNILISFFAAYSVIKGEMTLGMMMAVQYIIGQLNAPINQMIVFIQAAQDAKISLERLGEIHNRDDEEPDDQNKTTLFSEDKSIYIHQLSFRYNPLSEEVLHDINLVIPEGKITAIVGMSGSGKTTLMKLLLGFYPPTRGEIRVGEIKLQNLSCRAWRACCGVVMQDGFIFSDTIARNIAVGKEQVMTDRLLHAVKIGNVGDMIEKLPLGFNTKIGQEGTGISQGQRQRILIARSVYKNPEYIFFDEATNALDANNEKVIMENLHHFFKGKTVVVVAHRLSTVKNADQIIVLNQGKITETGTHASLIENRGEYYKLVKNQLEVGD